MHDLNKITRTTRGWFTVKRDLAHRRQWCFVIIIQTSGGLHVNVPTHTHTYYIINTFYTNKLDAGELCARVRVHEEREERDNDDDVTRGRTGWPVGCRPGGNRPDIVLPNQLK
jgi:hypothetical protein